MLGLLLEVPAVRDLFSAEERGYIELMAVFCAVYYGPYFLTTPIACRAAKNDLELIAGVRALRGQSEFSGICEEVLKVMDRHTDYLSARLIPLALADESLPEEERQNLAAAIFRELDNWDEGSFSDTEIERPGPNLASGDQFWTGGATPSLSSFVTPASFLIFHVIDQTPADLAWLGRPVSDWESYASYTDFKFYVKTKHVVNDAAERAIGLVKPLAGNFSKEENLQAALKTIDEVKAKYPKGKDARGLARTARTKAQLQELKPSEMLEREEPHQDTDSEDEDNNVIAAPPENALI